MNSITITVVALALTMLNFSNAALALEQYTLLGKKILGPANKLASWQHPREGDHGEN